MEAIPDIIEVRALDKYYIYLKFETGEEKIYDMSEHIQKIKFYEKLKNIEISVKTKKMTQFRLGHFLVNIISGTFISSVKDV